MNPLRILVNAPRVVNRLWTVVILTLLTTCLYAPEASAAYKFCTAIMPFYNDSNKGEDHLTGSVGAQRHKMELYRNGVRIWTGFADSDGCIPSPQSLAGNYTHVTWSHLSRGSVNVYVHKNDLSTLYGLSTTWNLPADNGGTVNKWTMMAGTPDDGVWRTTAVVGLALGLGLVADRTYRINAEHPVAAQPACTGCVIGNNMYLSQQNGSWVNLSKAAIAHEFGHLIQNSAFGSFGVQGVSVANYYCESVVETTCRCTTVSASPPSGECGNEQMDKLHCLNSREHLHAAFGEGWAHYYAAATLNNTYETSAVFPYYKNVIQSNGNYYWIAPVSHQVLPQTPYRWMTNNCNSSVVNKGTEMDWLSFLYYVGTQTASKYTLVDYHAVMTSTQVCGSWCTDADKVTWTKMRDGVDAQALRQPPWSDTKRNHFTTNGAVYGVNY